MRRKDREITDRAEMEAILSEAQVCRLALADGGEPYIVPLCFAYADNTIWFHSALEGKKVSLIQKNPQCCVEVDLTRGPVPDVRPCSWEYWYRSVVCTGTVRIVENYAEKKTGLRLIMQHYGAGEYDFSEPDLDRVCIVRIDITGMTGKKYGY
jgi:nitroimidazol reductase NimA-like FMN-containing flavoprotein (pyridoxamine 5'-phosphate oxidase superfamily)